MFDAHLQVVIEAAAVREHPKEGRHVVVSFLLYRIPQRGWVEFVNATIRGRICLGQESPRGTPVSKRQATTTSASLPLLLPASWSGQYVFRVDVTDIIVTRPSSMPCLKVFLFPPPCRFPHFLLGSQTDVKEDKRHSSMPSWCS